MLTGPLVLICWWWESNLRALYRITFTIKSNGSYRFDLKDLMVMIERDNQKGSVNQTTNYTPSCLL